MSRFTARESQKSPISTAADGPTMLERVGLPRRRVLLSTTSSWKRVALWIISVAAAKQMLSWLQPPRALATSSDTMGRIRFPALDNRLSLTELSMRMSDRRLSRTTAPKRSQSSPSRAMMASRFIAGLPILLQWRQSAASLCRRPKAYWWPPDGPAGPRANRRSRRC